MSQHNLKLKPGDEAPLFALPDQDGHRQLLASYRSQWVLVYFYPKDDTPGCTAEACAIRDVWDDFAEAGITVFGISADPVESHSSFAEKYELPFAILSDEDKSVIDQYGVWQEKSMFGKKYMGIARTSFLIDKKGKIFRIYEKVKPQQHAKEILKDVETAKKV